MNIRTILYKDGKVDLWVETDYFQKNHAKVILRLMGHKRSLLRDKYSHFAEHFETCGGLSVH